MLGDRCSLTRMPGARLNVVDVTAFDELVFLNSRMKQVR